MGPREPTLLRLYIQNLVKVSKGCLNSKSVTDVIDRIIA